MKKIFILLFILVLMSACSNGVSQNNQNSNTNSQAKSNNTKNADAYSDIVVIGGGGAGMAASIEAANNGASVIILEKMPFLGGNTIRSEGGLNAAETSSQKALGINDSVNSMIEDTLKGGKNINNKELVEFFAKNSAPTVEWLKSMGVDLSGVVQGAGASAKRMHRNKEGAKIGTTLVPVLISQLDNHKNIKYYTQITGNEIVLSDNGQVIGVKAKNASGKDLFISCNSVIIASGGFGANFNQVVSYRSDLKGFSTTNAPGTTGDGIEMAKKIGAALVDMEQIQTNPTVEVNTQIVISESVRGNGAIMVNQDGKRFTNELLTRDVLSADILKQPDKVAYLIYDNKIQNSMKVLKENFELGIITKKDSIEELAKSAKIDAKNLTDTLNKWNKAVSSKNDSEFKRDKGMESPLVNGPYYLIKVSPAIHYTMGGIKINTKNEVIKNDGSIIKGLYAAGEVTGGLHGANRLGGNAVADIMIFGRNAGLNAAQFVKELGFKSIKPLESIDDSKSSIKGNFKNGNFKTSAKGRNGEIELEVVIVDNSIKEIKILNHKETEAIFNPAKDVIIKNMIKNQTNKVDTVAGATISSKAIIEAVGKVLSEK